MLVPLLIKFINIERKVLNMITSFNPNNELYTRLLDKAWEALYNDPEGKLTPSEIAAGKFTSLDQYFSHMKDLVEIDPVYMMIPLDEQTEGIFKSPVSLN